MQSPEFDVQGSMCSKFKSSMFKVRLQPRPQVLGHQRLSSLVKPGQAWSTPTLRQLPIINYQLPITNALPGSRSQCLRKKRRAAATCCFFLPSPLTNPPALNGLQRRPAAANGAKKNQTP